MPRTSDSGARRRAIIDLDVDLYRLRRISDAALRLPPAMAINPEYAFLIDRNIDGATLEHADSIAQTWNVPIHHMLLSATWISDFDYTDALGHALEVPVVRWNIDFTGNGDHPWPPQPFGLTARVARAPLQVLSATLDTPAVLAEQIAALRAAGVPVAIAPNHCIEAALERVGRNQRLQRSVFGLYRAQPTMSARQSATRWQGLAIALVVTGGLIGAWLDASAAMQAALGIMSLAFLTIAVTRSLALIELFRAPRHAPSMNRRRPDDQLPTYSVLIPLFREASVLAGLVDAMARLDYPPALLEILLVIEDIDLETKAQLIQMALPGNVRIIVVPDQMPRTKPKALNYALETARGEYVVVYDAEDRPEPAQLRRAVDIFLSESADLACVQARLNIYNAHASWISRQFTIEYSALFDAILPSLERCHWPIPLGGTSNHFPRSVLDEIGGWDPFNVTEDADLGIRLARQGWRTRIVTATTWEEAPIYFRQWFHQRTRWLKGWMQTWLVHMRAPWRLMRELGVWKFIGFQVVVGGILLSALVHPGFYIIAVAAMVGVLIELPQAEWAVALQWVAWGNLVVGYLAAASVGAIAAARRRQRLTASIVLLPLYWLMISAAAYRALWQLWRAPHHWEKTPHGAAATSEQATRGRSKKSRRA